MPLQIKKFILTTLVVLISFSVLFHLSIITSYNKQTIPAPSPNKTKAWKRYENQTLGFSILYPNSFYVSEYPYQRPEVYISKDTYDAIRYKQGFWTSYIKISKYLVDPNEYTSQVRIGRYEAIASPAYNPLHARTTPLTALKLNYKLFFPITRRYFIQTSKDKYYLIEVQVQDVLRFDDLSLYNDILGSFSMH